VSVQLEQRIAVAENEISHNKKDLDEFFSFVRAHMEKEEKDRAELIALMQRLKTRVDRQTFFVSGVAATIAVVWTIAKVLIK